MSYSGSTAIVAPCRRLACTPAWLMAGLAYHVAGVWTADSEQTVRELAARGFPPSRIDRAAVTPRQMSCLGHAVFDFIDHEFGRSGIRRFLAALRPDAQAGGETPYETAFGMAPDDVDREFHQFMSERFR